jgi:inosine-uridine nucleoside N-ribohydrolase
MLLSTFALLTGKAHASERHKVILDTDLGFGSDDSMALLILLQSDNVDLLGVSVVTGNEWLAQETANVLRLLEIAGRTDVPVYPGARFPLVTNQQEMKLREALYGETSEGGYKGAWSEGRPDPDHVVPPDGTLAQKMPESTRADDFLIETIRTHPNEVVVMAIGPLTNVAIALAADPEIASLAKELVVMGGGIRTLPEFNFWMDPEAARRVLRAPWPKITLTPLNICEQAPFTLEVAKAASNGDTSIARYFNDTFLRRIVEHPVTSLMYDQIAALSFLEPAVVTRSEEMWIDVQIDHGPSYGLTLFWDAQRTPPPGVRKANVQFDLDYPRFIELFLELMKKTR